MNCLIGMVVNILYSSARNLLARADRARLGVVESVCLKSFWMQRGQWVSSEVENHCSRHTKPKMCPLAQGRRTGVSRPGIGAFDRSNGRCLKKQRFMMSREAKSWGRRSWKGSRQIGQDASLGKGLIEI